MANHVMIDIETLSTQTNAVILSVGICIFDKSGEILGKGLRNINVEGQKEAGRHVDENTLAWWNKQSDEAKKVLFADDKISMRDVYSWFSKCLIDFKVKYVWGNGSDFDNVIMNDFVCMCTHGRDNKLWKFYNNRCYRTLKNIYKGVEFERVGEHHNALDDAITQTNHLTAICKKHNITLEG